jgi:hypothetical protein
LFECLGDFACDGGFSASRSAGYSNDEWLGHGRNLRNLSLVLVLRLPEAADRGCLG